MVSFFFKNSTYLGKWSISTNIFQMGCNHQSLINLILTGMILQEAVSTLSFQAAKVVGSLRPTYFWLSRILGPQNPSRSIWPWGGWGSLKFTMAIDTRRYSPGCRLGVPRHAVGGTLQPTDASDPPTDRLFYPLINEGFKILEQGYVARSSDIDLVCATGRTRGKSADSEDPISIS